MPPRDFGAEQPHPSCPPNRRTIHPSTTRSLVETPPCHADLSVKHIRRASATSSASLNILPDLIYSPAIFIKLKSNIERHSQSKLGRDPLPFKEPLRPEMAM